ncbi:MAG TPA: helix-turn-helix domain-containing protein [Candidatus Limnocylindria bacterium]|nr:helix-turn-helix domain-containing protein [Candidatus Limnocylindria bacterium]
MPRRRPPVPRAPRSTRDRILEVAGRHFADRGFAGASVRQIAAEAGLRNQASLYHHFRNKRALYEAALARGIEPILSLVGESRDDGGSGTDMVARLVAYLAAHPHLPRLIHRLGLEDQRYLPSVVPRVIRPLYAEGVKALARQRPSWSAAMLPHVAIGFYHLIFGYFVSAPLLQATLALEATAPAAVRRQQAFVREALTRLVGPSRPRRRPSR